MIVIITASTPSLNAARRPVSDFPELSGERPNPAITPLLLGSPRYSPARPAGARGPGFPGDDERREVAHRPGRRRRHHAELRRDREHLPQFQQRQLLQPMVSYRDDSGRRSDRVRAGGPGHAPLWAAADQAYLAGCDALLGVSRRGPRSRRSRPARSPGPRDKRTDTRPAAAHRPGPRAGR